MLERKVLIGVVVIIIVCVILIAGWAIIGFYPKDTDGDGMLDSSDAFPLDPSEWSDTDNDGVGDNGDDLPYDSNETVDTDGDGIGDNADEFPNDANETVDTDGDGIGDNADEFPNDANETKDTDGDGYGDNLDDVNIPEIWARQYQAILSYQNLSIRRNSAGITVVGITVNNKTSNVDYGVVIVTTRLANGTLWLNGTEDIGYMRNIILKPGDEYPFVVNIQDQNDVITDVEINVYAAYTEEEPANYSEFIAVQHNGEYSVVGPKYTVTGTVTNIGDVRIAFGQIYVQFYHNNGSFIFSSYDYTYPGSIGWGESASFIVSCNYLPDEVGSYRVMIFYI